MKTALCIAALLLMASPICFAKDRTYRGQVMDSTCAKMGNHDAGYKLTGTHTPKDCTLACVNSGAKLVLYNPRTKTAYEFEDQDKAKDLAGENVKVEGSVDPSTKTIHVDKIEPVK